MKTYKLTIVMTADNNPQDWLFEAIDQVSDWNQNEKIIDTEITEVTE